MSEDRRPPRPLPSQPFPFGGGGKWSLVPLVVLGLACAFAFVYLAFFHH